MTFHQKLARLMRDMNVSAVARRAGISQLTLWKYLHEGRMPMANCVVSLASALGVEAGWLIDDSKPWPPIRVEQTEQTAAHVAAA
jgi:transcriptional regulator with XRE-family HTH domain